MIRYLGWRLLLTYLAVSSGGLFVFHEQPLSAGG
jgi:hypothetical protein